MTLSIEDLTKVYDENFAEGLYDDAYTWGQPTAHHAGIRAVVTALRDEFRNWIDADKMFDEILAPRGDEAAGKGANTVDAQQCQTNTTKPAAAPDVCEWAVERGPYYETSCGFGCSTLAAGTLPRSKFFCARCSRPIKFVEAAR